MQDKTIEEYCRLINKLDVGTGVRSVDLAKTLTLSRNTIALTLQKLVDEKYIFMKRYGRVHLTQKGKRIARKMNF